MLFLFNGKIRKFWNFAKMWRSVKRDHWRVNDVAIKNYEEEEDKGDHVLKFSPSTNYL